MRPKDPNLTYMKKNSWLILIAALLFFHQRVLSQQQPDTADSIKSWLTYLASDEMRGRANGTHEIEDMSRLVDHLTQLLTHIARKDVEVLCK